MSLRVNRSPVAEETLEAIRAHCPTLEFVIDTIGAEELDADGKEILAGLTVEGEPAEGITLHGTRYGRKWCAFIAA